MKPVKQQSTGNPTDYDVVRRAVEFISRTWREQPSLEAIAEEVGMAPLALQRLFTRWAGLTPKGFVQALTLDYARTLLSDSASILDASYEVGFSGPARLHDLFVTHEAMTPGAYKARGEGITIRFGFHASPFGNALVMVTDRGLAGLAFADGGGERAALEDMRARWPRADYVEDRDASGPYARRIFDPATWSAERPLRIVMIGSDFEIRVWETLLKLPFGKATTYSDIAGHIGRPTAARAVGTAVGRNPVSFVIPCHRVLGKSGGLCGYHWGLTRKRAIFGWEAGLVGAEG
ncbi:MAG: bifunctional helix-turn-helix domain-containing protein/methylated-DNA--[protein]-cysteine S-methyltransferase, partial [Rhizobiales bacterium]|nr:bifunctional helix-turn-helix domain-containing protein/methylated-DNA--[protein]-cysteine S-methyltransferase [Hyphomicrobiales bacterium]